MITVLEQVVDYQRDFKKTGNLKIYKTGFNLNERV
jgi:hypothetical protein